MSIKAFAQTQELYTVTIQWKHGFKHSYEQKLNLDQITTEQERIENLRWVESVIFERNEPA